MKVPYLFFLLFASVSVSFAGEGKVHLFILSGQSNMARFDPRPTFIPAVESAFGADQVVVVKDALGGQPIRRWYKDWLVAAGDTTTGPIGDLYDRLMAKVKPAVEGKELASVSFVWMQGERDAREKHASLYQEAFNGVLDQIRKDLQFQDLNIVVGRLSDFDMSNQRYADWTKLREIQMEIADSAEYGAWVDTDDLNDGVDAKGRAIHNDLHYSVEGYKIFGQRLADASIELIQGRLAGE
ncbi:sialate O-acetylesterase [Coraliomargarita parva]|uniref:sialate O-acetylesterase n=1 Tax=Coraliomargarita parva TaxID=3014050 RepID=UPI0022B5AA18|nr:sialate O-acetylesterase [Coraliomargarita parva]